MNDLAIALHAPLTNLAGWIFLAVRRPFVIGDRIQIGDHAGDVIDMRLFAFSLVEIGNWVDADQSTGRILHIPNGQVFQQTVANYTQGFNFIWEDVLDAFWAADDIDFAYPTTRYYDNRGEGKPGRPTCPAERNLKD